MGAGWVHPISYMLRTDLIQVSECNAVVKTVTNFFRQMCLPGALNSFYNQFGKCRGLNGYLWVIGKYYRIKKQVEPFHSRPARYFWLRYII